MAFFVRLMERGFNDPLIIPAVELIPEQYSWHSIGGPKSAEIAVKATNEDSRALWEMLEWLRCPIEIFDHNQRCVWWGYVSEVEITVGALTVGVTLDSMSNKVATLYETETQQKATTTWNQDDGSVSTYGTKELLLTSTTIGQDAAEYLRDEYLIFYKKPIPNISIDVEPGELSARLICRGWWSTLSWQYYSNIAGKVSYEDIGSGLTNLGDAGARSKLAQSFQIVGDTVWEAQYVKLRMKKEETPADNLVVGLYSDSAGEPGSLLASASLSGASVNENLNWQTLQLNTKVALTVGTIYWLVVERSGAIDAINYYKIDANEDLGYTGGVMKIWNGSAWVARDPDADMLFYVGGVEETTKQIKNIITACGQFITGTEIKNVSGISVNPFRQGDNDGLFEAESLLEIGSSSGKRLISTVTREREVLIAEEPALDPYKIGIYILEDGSLINLWGDTGYASVCPVGDWAQLKDVIPGSLDFGLLADPTIFFIEEATYDIANERYIPTARGQGAPLGIGTKISEG